jgi:thioredoxin 1
MDEQEGILLGLWPLLTWRAGNGPSSLGEWGKWMSQLTTALTDANFDETVKGSDRPVLVDFWAEWCGPCKMVEPILEEIANENEGKLVIGKLNVDDNLEITRRFDVLSIPTMILFKDGEPQLRLVGAKGKAQLLQELSRHLS